MLLTFLKRFTEKRAHEWRQIYKSLQLLEYLVKNGSEKVVDFAKSHIAVIEMLQNFHYTNSEGKDQGINVRNRSKELLSLLKDVSKIRAERKSAKAKKSKYSGTGSSQSGGFGGSGKKYGGFGSESSTSDFGGHAGGIYGDGGGFGGNEYEGPGYSRSSRSHTADDEFEEYEITPTSEGSNATKHTSVSFSSQPPKADLFSFDDQDTGYSNISTPPTSVDNEDDFADFQSASPTNVASASSSTSKPLPATQSDNLFDLFSSAPPSAFHSAPVSNNNSSSLLSLGNNSTQSFGPPLKTAGISTNLTGSRPTINSGGSQAKKVAKDDAFGSLWATASSKATSTKPKTTGTTSSLI